MKLQCLACGQQYQFNRANPPWPACSACLGTLAPVLEAPLGLTPYTQAAPVAAAPVGFGDNMWTLPPAKPAAASNLRLIWTLGISGAIAVVLLLLIVVPALVMMGGKPVAQAPSDIPAGPAPKYAPTSFASSSSSAPATSPAVAPTYVPPAPTVPPPAPPRPVPTSVPVEPDPAPSASRPKTKSEGGSKLGPLRPGRGRGQSGFSDAETFQPRTDWKVAPDPLEATEPAPERLIDIDFKTKVNRLVFPSRPSTFFAAVTDDYRNPEIRIYDWRSNRPARRFSGKLNHQKELTSLSADGNQMATVVSRGGDEGIVIVDTRNGKETYSIGLERSSDVKGLTFAGPNRFLAIVKPSGSDARNRVGVWNLEDENVVADFELEAPDKDAYLTIRPESVAISPGGKHLAVVLNKFVCLYEIETGELIGELALPHDGALYDASLTFSPDGTEMVIIAGGSIDGALLYRIDVAAGEVVGSAKINAADFKEVHFYQNFGRLQFLRSLNCYLVDGAFVVEAETGETIYRIDAFQGMARVVDGDRVVGVAARARSSGIAEMKLPTAEIEKLAAVFKQGGKLLDGIWGEAKTGSVASVPSLQLPTAMTEWSLPPFTTGERAKGKKNITLAAPADSARSWLIDLPIFSQSAAHIAWLPRNDRASSRLFAVDTVTGKAAGDIDMLPGSRALDISPDGSLVIAAVGKRSLFDEEGYERLEVFSIPQKKHVFAWQLGGLVENAASGDDSSSDAMLFQQAFFIEKNLVLTRMKNGRIVLWKLPMAEALWRLDGEMRIVDFSPDRSYVQLHLPKLHKFAWLEVRTGKWMGDLRAGDRWTATKLALSPDGKRTASLVAANGYSLLTVRSVADQDDEGQTFEVPQVQGPLTWLDDWHLAALSSGIVFDGGNGAAIWKISAKYNVLRSPDGTYWLSQRDRAETTLTRTQFPSDKLLSSLKRSRSEPILPIVGAGAHVAVQSGFDSDPAALQRIDSDFASRGWVRDPNGQFRLNGLASQQPGTTVNYQSLLSREQTSVTIPGGTKIKITMTDAANQVVWQTEFVTGGGGYAPSVVFLRDGESLQQKVTGNQSNPKPEVSMVPDRIFPAKALSSLPSMQLTEKGEQF